MKDKLRELRPAFLLSSAVCILLLLYAPFELLLNNTYEFWYNIYDILKFMLPAALIAVVLMTALFFVLRRLNRRLSDLFLALLLVFFICTYVQGTFLAGDLPPLDGRKIAWSEYDFHRLPGILLWAAALVVVFFLLFRLKGEKFSRVAAFFGGISSVILLVSLLILVISTGSYRKSDALLPNEYYMLDMSEDENFVVFLVDAVDAEAYAEVAAVHPEYKDIFENFTVFDNVMSGYPYTSRSIPFILSGKWYENDGDFSAFCEDAFAQSPLFARLKTENYRMGFYDAGFFYIKCLEDMFENISGAYSFAYPDRFLKMQLMMAGYRYFPYDLKRFCVLTPENFYIDTLKTNGLGSEYSQDNQTFMERLEEKTVTLSDEKCFRYIYVRGAHEPYIYPAISDEIEDNSYLSSVELSLEMISAYLEKLREGGVYDSSVIVFLSDHGYVENDVAFGRQNPFLMVKGKNEHHEYRVSDLPVSHEFLPEAFDRLLDGDLSEEAFLREDQDAPRRYLFYEYGKEGKMWEYYQTGHASDESTMEKTGKEYIFAG